LEISYGGGSKQKIKIFVRLSFSKMLHAQLNASMQFCACFWFPQGGDWKVHHLYEAFTMGGRKDNKQRII